MSGDKNLDVLIGDCFTHVTSGETFIVVSIKRDLRGETLELWHESRFKDLVSKESKEAI